MYGAPTSIAPGRETMPLGLDVRNGVKALRAPGTASTKPGRGKPTAAPRAVSVYGLKPVLRTGGQMTTLPPDIRLERPPIQMDRGFEHKPGKTLRVETRSGQRIFVRVVGTRHPRQRPHALRSGAAHLPPHRRPTTLTYAAADSLEPLPMPKDRTRHPSERGHQISACLAL